jgi:hypothetical protein
MLGRSVELRPLVRSGTIRKFLPLNIFKIVYFLFYRNGVYGKTAGTKTCKD